MLRNGTSWPKVALVGLAPPAVQLRDLDSAERLAGVLPERETPEWLKMVDALGKVNYNATEIRAAVPMGDDHSGAVDP